MLGKLKSGKEAPPPNRLLCFVHVPKTAGTSVVDLLRRNYPGAAFAQFVVAGRKDANGAGKTLASPDEDIRALIEAVRADAGEIKVVTGHFPYGLHRFIDRPVDYVTILREPMARSLSQYYHLMDATRNSALRRILTSYDFDFERALGEGAALQFCNDQTRLVIGSDKIVLDEGDLQRAKEVIAEGYAFVGLQERLDDCVKHLARRFGWTTTELPRLNVGRTDIPPPDPKTSALFEAYNRLDLELFRWVRDDYLPSRIGRA
jgi:hypothetical protein